MSRPPTGAEQVVVIGAGPAGLTAAWDLAERNHPAVVLEADDIVGGISRTVERDGWRFDIGGHRFFTKVTAVEKRWREILPEDDFLLRPRSSRIFYQGAFFDYPLRLGNALRGLGVLEATRCVLSYLGTRLRPPKDQSTFEGWVAARFGWRLYAIFFKTYTEKVWGVPATSIQADWAAQRIKNLSLSRAVFNALDPRRGKTEVTSLIDEFHYPRYGPGMMWEEATRQIEMRGVPVHLRHRVVGLSHSAGRVHQVHVDTPEGQRTFEAAEVISSMPINLLVQAMDPPPPPEVREAAANLRHRDFLTVALVIPRGHAFPDNWIYIHSPEVRLGRVQNFGTWSEWMVKPGRTCLGLEYFVNVGDDLWEMPDDDLIAFATAEIESIGLISPGEVEAGYVVRIPKAYPVYDSGYAENVEVLRRWLAENATNVHPVGRNGMHKYNNQDHSMFTAMLTVENIFGADNDVWSVNVEDEYIEEGVTNTGRDAPVLPAPVEFHPVEEVEVALVVPTRDERENVAVLLERLPSHPGLRRVLFVDDSDDGTAGEVTRLGRSATQPRISARHREPTERSGGLGGAVLEGIRLTEEPWIAVMDGDLQHPPELLSRLIDRAAGGDVDLVIATRLNWDSVAEGLSPTRRLLSAAAGKAATALVGRRIAGIVDPLSGYFLVRRDALNVDALDPTGFKILLEILATHPGMRTAEVGYEFGRRRSGSSKGGIVEGVRYLRHLASMRRRIRTQS